eukprot:6234322-Alexandrium_andersonii.AAC.1
MAPEREESHSVSARPQQLTRIRSSAQGLRAQCLFNKRLAPTTQKGCRKPLLVGSQASQRCTKSLSPAGLS